MTVELSHEDSLRLNVLAANAEAIRINENTLEVFGLKDDQEMRVQLHPTGKADPYLKQVRELLATLALDSPGGYPVYIERWTRMGQLNSERLDSLLKLGDPEAVLAVVSSPSLTDSLAKLAWWSEPHAEYARRMLHQPAVLSGAMGPVLADFLIEHLPFETEHQIILETVALILQPNLIDLDHKQKLWKRGRSNKSYRAGFLLSAPNDIPDKSPEHQSFNTLKQTLQSQDIHDNQFANLLLQLLSSEGQTYVQALLDAMLRPADQDVVSAIFKSIGLYFSAARLDDQERRHIDEITSHLHNLEHPANSELNQLCGELPELRSQIDAMLFLANVDDALLIPIFSMTDAVGSVMRKKIAPVVDPIKEQLGILGSGS